MDYIFDNNIPIYLQIIEIIKINIISDKYKPGQQLKPVRTLAEEFEVNPNTIQRALSELENLGLVYSKRTKGRFVTEDIELIYKIKKNLAINEVENLINSLKNLGYSSDEITALIEEAMGGEK
ncbi:GntR family transcriptional regulator [Peptostreptococcus faecalis]|uniref:GntR family transcriptional regulator n=1 Tax=Peptostreptococcus faecalis TaxID=2045015 RepID=UPI000C7C01A4|nr:GntR family transcriptional regulator [Peptostreptococcus faecalis]